MSEVLGDRPRHSRRDVLKKTAVAGGIAWTAPVISTLATPVAAADGSVSGFYTYCFELGLEGWTTTGLWALSTQKSVSASTSLHYGNAAGTGTPGTYNTGGTNSGTATSPTFTVPTSGSRLLEFDVWREVETFGSGTWDEFTVSILPAGTTLYAVSRDGGTGLGPTTFQHITIDLAGYGGSAVQLVFGFDTKDGNFNNFEGIYVDNVIVPGATAPGGGGGVVTGAQNRSMGGPDWMPNRPAPTKAEQRRRDRAARAARFESGEREDGDLQAGIKSG